MPPRRSVPEDEHGVDTGFDEALSDGLNVEPVLLRDLHLSQTVRVVGDKRRERHQMSRCGTVRRGFRGPCGLSPSGVSRRCDDFRSAGLTRTGSTPLTHQRSLRTIELRDTLHHFDQLPGGRG